MTTTYLTNDLEKTSTPIAPHGYRFLVFRETIRSGDLIACGQEWVTVSSLSIGSIVNNYAFYLRRKE